MTQGMKRGPKFQQTPYKRLLAYVADVEGTTRAVAVRVIERYIAELPELVWASGRLVVPGLAVFVVRKTKARRVRNPATGKLMRLPSGRAVKARVVAAWRHQSPTQQQYQPAAPQEQ